LSIEGKTRFTRIHDLHRLYKMIGPEIRRRIDDLWDTDIWQPFRRECLETVEAATKRQVPRDLSSALKAGALTFIDLRYVFEQPKRKIDFILGDLPQVLKKVILEIHPEWL